MNCPDCGREIKQEKYSGGESYPKYHRAVDCISNLRADLAAERAKVERRRGLLLRLQDLLDDKGRLRITPSLDTEIDEALTDAPPASREGDELIET